MEEEIAEIVRKHGWYAASISDHKPPFVYTIGLMYTQNHPEFNMFGLDAGSMHALISQLIQNIRTGRPYIEPGVYTVEIGGHDHRVGFRRVHRTLHELYLGFAMGYCRHIGRWGELEAMQAFWPDSNGKFPFDVGCALAFINFSRGSTSVSRERSFGSASVNGSESGRTKNAPELPIALFLKSKSLGGNRVILVVSRRESGHPGVSVSDNVR